MFAICKRFTTINLVLLYGNYILNLVTDIIQMSGISFIFMKRKIKRKNISKYPILN